MVNDRLRTMRKVIPKAFLALAVAGLGSEAQAGQAGEVQAGTVIDQARAGAQAASGARKGSSATSPVPGAKKSQPPQQNAGKKAPAGSKKEAAPPIPTPGKSPVIVGLRDPFKLPPPPGPAAETGGEEIRGPLPPGARGLVINQLKLEGIVRLDQSNTMIAVVTSYTNRAYFLHENDPVFNGVVSKITPDSVVFRENYLDQFGRAQVREVVRRLSGALGEGR